MLDVNFNLAWNYNGQKAKEASPEVDWRSQSICPQAAKQGNTTFKC
jgi:hypothetical protein